MRGGRPPPLDVAAELDVTRLTQEAGEQPVRVPLDRDEQRDGMCDSEGDDRRDPPCTSDREWGLRPQAMERDAEQREEQHHELARLELFVDEQSRLEEGERRQGEQRDEGDGDGGDPRARPVVEADREQSDERSHQGEACEARDGGVERT